MKTLDTYLKTIPDFPRPGMQFRDISPLLADPDGLCLAVDTLEDKGKDVSYDVLCGAESRGFVFVAPIARDLHRGLILIRKKGKLPGKIIEANYDLEYTGRHPPGTHRDVRLQDPRGGAATQGPDRGRLPGRGRAGRHLPRRGVRVCDGRDEAVRGAAPYMRTNNHLERLNREIKRRTRVIGVFPNTDAAVHMGILSS